MQQQLASDVYADVKEVSLRRPTPTEPKRCVQALQYVLHNRGMQRVTVRVDFSASQHVQLVLPDDEDGECERDPTLVFDVVVGPLQRRATVSVVRDAAAQAFVRVAYSVVEVLPVETNENWRDVSAKNLNQLVTQSRVTFSALHTTQRELFCVGKGLALPQGADAIDRFCRDLNRFSRQKQVRFVDPVFSPTPTALWGNAEPPAWMRKSHAMDSVTWRHLGDVIDASWKFHDSQGDRTSPSRVCWMYEGLAAQESWICAIDSLTDQASAWCERWFGERQCKRLCKTYREVDALSVVSVSLWEDGMQRKSVVTDLLVPVVDSADDNGGLLSSWPRTGDFYTVILQKAHAKLCGSYAAVALKSTRTIVEELTGVPTIEIFPHGAWQHGNVLENARRMEQHTSKKPRQKTPQRLVMISFRAIDEHHCGFRLLGVSESPPSQPILTIRDPVGMLYESASAKAGSDGRVYKAEGECFLTEMAFNLLEPIVYEVLVDHTNSWRRRKIELLSHHRIVTMQFALSCSSLQVLAVRASAAPYKTIKDVDVEAISILADRVDDNGSLRRLGGDEVAISSGQCTWTATAGEYIVTVAATIRSLPRDEAPSEGRTLAPSSLQDNFCLLFQLLDQDMDGVVSKAELLDLFRVHEQLTHVELAKVSECVDRFIDIHAGGSAPGLYLDDLIDVYKSLLTRAGSELPDAASHDDEDQALVLWRDLVQLLGCENVAEVDRDNLWELSCVVSSDRDDLVTVGLT